MLQVEVKFSLPYCLSNDQERGRYFSPLLEVQTATRAEPLTVQWVRRVFSRGYRGRGVRLTTQFHLGPRVKASEAAGPLPMINGENFKFSISRHSSLNDIEKQAFQVFSHTHCSYMCGFP